MPTLVSFREVFDARDGAIELSSGRVGAVTNNTHTRAFVAEFLSTDSLNGDDVALATPGVPRIGDVYQSAAGVYDLDSFCGGVKAAQLGAPWIWKLTASYTSDIDLSNPSGDPLLMPPVFDWGDKMATKPAALYNAAGDLVAGLNSAGDPIDPPITEEEPWTTLKITRNFATFDSRNSAKFKNKVNFDAWLGYQPGEVLCVGLSASSDYQKGVVFWKVVGSFEIKPNGPDSWAVKVLDRGFQGFNAAGVKTVLTDASTGRALSGASLLDGTGKALARNAAPVYLTFYPKLSVDFAGIRLP